MSGPLLICTDLDRTLIPNGPQSESPAARERFSELAARPEVTLAYVSGRHRALIERAIVNYRLPLPDFVIGDVGTTIYRVGPQQL
ncbi:MAG: haloacid dehalogenase, partial [Halobacteria archaeon]|nr:haloacid dehalogenase [Halobacteria archaeon]